MDCSSILLLGLTILALLIYLIKRRYSYWADRGVAFVPPTFPFGNLQGVSFKKTIGEIVQDNYKKLKGKGPLVGLYTFTDPTALVMDLDLLRNVFVKDFQYFENRGVYVNEKKDPLSAHLFAIEGEKWKSLRAKLTPTFTSGKMKMVHSTLLRVADQFNEHLQSSVEKDPEVDLKVAFAQFTSDIIGNVAFGLECNSMKDPNNEFTLNGRRFFEPPPLEMLKRLLIVNFPKIAKKLNMRFIRKEVSDFFIKTIRETVAYREKNNIQRNDLLQLLLQLKNTGKIDEESTELETLTFNELAAQTFVFFIAGYETSSSTLTFATFELARNQEVQDKARRQIEEVLDKHGGEMSYDAVMEMTYLDQIINESLRKYPIASALKRRVEKPYKVPGTDIVLEKDMGVIIPVLAIHRDPEYFPEPEKFDPDRFTKESIAARHPYAWLPFGEGQRNCIGMRFGMMEARIGLATILKNFRLKSSDKTPEIIKFRPSSLVLSPVGGMHLNLEKI